MAAADSRSEIAALLSKAVIDARLDADTLCLGFPARDRQELALAGAARRRQAGCVTHEFVADVAGRAPRPLGQGLWLVASDRGVEVPSLSLATPDGTLNQPPNDSTDRTLGVLCLAAQGDAHRGLLERVVALLESGSAGELQDADAATILARFAGESTAASTCQARLLNAHGLHARPTKLLVQVARVQGMPIRVRLTEGGAEAVSASSLTKVINLGARRGHPELSAQADGLHPAVLKLIEMTVTAAHAQGKWVGVCGELASDAVAVPVLVGLGVDELSVSARQVPLVKARLREFDLAGARAQAQLALAQATSEAVRDALEVH